MLKVSDELLAANYSTTGGSSGGPLLHFKGKDIYIVGINHGSMAVGDYFFQKVSELWESKIPIPKDLKVSFSSLQDKI